MNFKNTLNWLLKSVFFAFAFFQFSCSSSPGGKGMPKVVKAPCSKIFKQGIRGKVSYLEGNLMPSPDGELRMPNKVVQRTLGIFAPTPVSKTTNNGDMTFYSDIQTKCLYLIKTDKNGCYSFNLPDGKYSILVWEENKWFGTIFDENMVINPIVVEKGKVTNLDIQINHKAVY